MIRPLGNGSLINLPVKFRRGHGKIRLADHNDAVRHIGQLPQPFSPALTHTGSSHHTEGHIAAHLRTQLRQRQNGEWIAIVSVQRPEYRRRVSAAAAHAGLHGNAFGDANFKSAGVFAHGVAVDFCRFPGQILLPRGNALLVAMQPPGLSRADVQFNIAPMLAVSTPYTINHFFCCLLVELAAKPY